MVLKIAQGLQDTQDQLNPSDSINLVFKFFDQQMPRQYGVMQVSSRSIGNAFTVGHAVNGIIGTANGVNGSQITIGTGGLGASGVVRVLSLNNTFMEPLRNNTYVDTDETTATVDTTNYRIDF